MALVFATQGQIDGLRQRVEKAGGKPAPADAPALAAPPDLAKAFAVAGDAPLRLALVPSGAAGQEFMEETFAAAAGEVGDAGDKELLARGLRWATIAVKQEPSLGATLTLRAADAGRAERLEALVNKLLAFVKANQEEGGEDGAALVKRLDAVKPMREGETVTLRFDPALLPLVAIGSLRAEGEIDADGDVHGDVKPKPDKPEAGGR